MLIEMIFWLSFTSSLNKSNKQPPTPLQKVNTALNNKQKNKQQQNRVDTCSYLNFTVAFGMSSGGTPNNVKHAVVFSLRY